MVLWVPFSVWGFLTASLAQLRLHEAGLSLGSGPDFLVGPGSQACPIPWVLKLGPLTAPVSPCSRAEKNGVGVQVRGVEKPGFLQKPTPSGR